MITTKSIGIGEDTANPKPVRHINWTGQPMKEGDNYWGEAEPQAKLAMEQTVTPARLRRAKRARKAWSPESRAAYSERMKAWWKAKKEQSTTKQGET